MRSMILAVDQLEMKMRGVSTRVPLKTIGNPCEINILRKGGIHEYFGIPNSRETAEIGNPRTIWDFPYPQNPMKTLGRSLILAVDHLQMKMRSMILAVNQLELNMRGVSS